MYYKVSRIQFESNWRTANIDKLFYFYILIYERERNFPTPEWLQLCKEYLKNVDQSSVAQHGQGDC